MSEIIGFGGGEFELLAKNMPKDAKRIYNLEGRHQTVLVKYSIKMYNDLVIDTALMGSKELGLTFDDRDELEAMLGFAQDNARQEQAEEGA